MTTSVRERKRTTLVKIVVKVGLHPVLDADLIQLLRTATNKSAIVREALRGRPVQQLRQAEDDKLDDALEAFVL